VTIDIVSRLEPVNFEEEQFDAALQRREMRSATVQWDDLMEERLVVVGSPTLVSSPVPDDELGPITSTATDDAADPCGWTGFGVAILTRDPS
jgi:hypothetical protein